MQYYKKNLLYLICTGWGTLGFNRGLNQYEYEYKYDNYYKKPYFYTDKLCTGILGLFIYINPGFIPITFYKEIYRLEIKLRGFEEEKETKNYNKILF